MTTSISGEAFEIMRQIYENANWKKERVRKTYISSQKNQIFILSCIAAEKWTFLYFYMYAFCSLTHRPTDKILEECDQKKSDL